jgi:hypothetical protein
MRLLMNDVKTLTQINRDNTRLIAAQSGYLEYIAELSDEGWKWNGTDVEWDQGSNVSGGNPEKINPFALGGIGEPGMLAMYAEHSPRPIIERLTERVAFSPGLPPRFAGAGNDNGALIARMDAMMRMLSAIGAAIVNAENKTGREVADAVVGAIQAQTGAIQVEMRQDRNNPKNKAA